MKKEQIIFALVSSLFLSLYFTSLAYCEGNNLKNNTIAEIKRFISFKLGMEQSEFRFSIPQGWIPSEAMYSKKQNRNSVGEYNEGYFYYIFNTPSACGGVSASSLSLGRGVG